MITLVPPPTSPPIEVRVGAQYPELGDYRALDANRQGPQFYFVELVRHDPRMSGRVLDVGCGGRYPNSQPIAEMLRACDVHDGIDPRAIVNDHPGLRRRWCGRFELLEDLPSEAYDAVFAYNVVEHVRDPGAFLARAWSVLRPGGVLYAYTPHGNHPFALISRAIQAVGIKDLWRRAARGHVNVYPAYYRMNRRRAVGRSGGAAGFAELEFHYLPCLHWDSYFPPWLRFLPHLYDRAIGARLAGAAQLCAFKLEKQGGASRSATGSP
jgi:SAM-dependent methyltransferase